MTGKKGALPQISTKHELSSSVSMLPDSIKGGNSDKRRKRVARFASQDFQTDTLQQSPSQNSRTGVSESLSKFFKAEAFLKMTKTKQDQTKLSREIKYQFSPQYRVMMDKILKPTFHEPPKTFAPD